MHELTVVLVNHNGAGCLPAALSALAAETECADVQCVVVDSGSSDGSWREVDRYWSRARALRFDTNVGFCVGCNRGAEEGDGRLLAFVNFDGRVEPGWDTPLREVLADPSVAVATGLLLDPDGGTIQAAGLEIAPNMGMYGRLDRLPRGAAGRQPVDVAVASGALMMVRRADFLALGGFYEPFFMYGEETDYCLRARGRVVLAPVSAIRHEYGHASGPRFSAFRRYLSSRNRLLNAARHLPPAAVARSVAASAAFDLATLHQSEDGLAAALRTTLRGWRDGLAAMPAERRARTPAERRDAVRRLVTFRAALAEYRRVATAGNT